MPSEREIDQQTELEDLRWRLCRTSELATSFAHDGDVEAADDVRIGLIRQLADPATSIREIATGAIGSLL